MKIAAFLQDLAGGGAERVALTLLNALAEQGGHEIILVIARREGPYLADVSPAIRLVDLGGASTARSVPRLARLLKVERPDILMTHLTHVNVAGALALRLAGGRTRQVAVEHNQMDLNFARLQRRSVKIAYRLARWLYSGIAAVVSVSAGVEASVLRFTGLRHSDNFHILANPVVTPRLRALLKEAPAHPWLRDDGPPVLLGCGRLMEQKDFPNLIEAFRLVREQRPARLLILGEGPDREMLEALVAQAGLGEHAALPGFDRNPYAAMASARIFVLSSRWEGLPTVLIEALAAGANVVSTDCPSGPDEVLDGGKYGRLVPVADAPALARAIITTLDAPAPRNMLIERAEQYSLESATGNYLALFRSLLN